MKTSIIKTPRPRQFVTAAALTTLVVAGVAGSLIANSWTWLLTLPLAAAVAWWARKPGDSIHLAADLAGTNNVGNLRSLEKRLKRLRTEPGLEGTAGLAAQQFTQTVNYWIAFNTTLHDRLSPTELTFHRYHGGGLQVWTALISALEGIAESLTELAVAKLESLKAQHRKALKADPALAQALQQRLNNWSEKQEKLSSSLQRNEAALNDLERLREKIHVTLDNRNNADQPALDEALAELEELGRLIERFAL